MAALTDAGPGPVADLLGQLEALQETIGKGDLGLDRKSPVPLRVVVFRDLDSFARCNVLREDGSAATAGQAAREAVLVALVALPAQAGERREAERAGVAVLGR